MTSDDLKKIFLGPTLFRLDTILSPKLVPILYATGLASLLLWAVTHLFATFGRNFGDGLWGLLEIAVFGLLGLVTLRIVCEALLVYFKDEDDYVPPDEPESPASPSTALDVPPQLPPSGSPVKRTARRSPPPAKP